MEVKLDWNMFKRKGTEMVVLSSFVVKERIDIRQLEGKNVVQRRLFITNSEIWPARRPEVGRKVETQ
jgi:hypothetical protein